MALYMQEENRIAEGGWRIIMTIKDLMFIDSGFSNNFWAEAIEIANYLRNKLPIRSKNHSKIIPEKSWTGKRQNL